MLSIESLGDLVGPLARSFGERVARLFGVNEELALRLERVHSPLDVTAFRVRQLGVAIAAFGAASLASLAIRPAVPVALFLLLGAPLLAFLALEQQVASASTAWQRRLFLELPGVSEQLAMLLSAGRRPQPPGGTGQGGLRPRPGQGVRTHPPRAVGGGSTP